MPGDSTLCTFSQNLHKVFGITFVVTRTKYSLALSIDSFRGTNIFSCSHSQLSLLSRFHHCKIASSNAAWYYKTIFGKAIPWDFFCWRVDIFVLGCFPPQINLENKIWIFLKILGDSSRISWVISSSSLQPFYQTTRSPMFAILKLLFSLSNNWFYIQIN